MRASGNGGAIDFYGGAVLVCDHCRFVECKIDAGRHEEGYGGAIFLSHQNSNLTCQFCVFTDCHGSSGGGAINIDSPSSVILQTCDFTTCTTGSAGGGVLRVNGGKPRLFVTGCTIKDCSGRGGPGTLIKVGGSNTFINEMQFADNTIQRTTQDSYYTGTTISLGFLDGYGKVTISGCRFSNHNANPMLSITGSQFPEGAVFDNCNFTDNQFQGDKGIVTVQAASSTYNNCLFRNIDVMGENGQAIIALGSATTTFDTCVFEECTTTTNSGIIKGSDVRSTTLGFNNCDFILCTGGHGIIRNGLVVTNVEFTSCDFDSFQTKEGGALLQTQTTGTSAIDFLMEQCNFTNCGSDDVTSAALLDIRNQLATLRIQFVKFEWNRVSIASIQTATSVNFSNVEFVAGSVPQGSKAINIVACQSFFALELCGFKGLKTGSEFVLAAASVPTVSITNCTFQDHDTKLMDVQSTEKLTVTNSQFAFKVAQDVNPISLGSPSTEVAACDFVVEEGEEENWNTYLLVYSGASITFTDCCFSYGKDFENSTIQFRYVSLKGQGSATLSGVCFEGEERFAISKDQFTVSKEDNTTFEDCVCSVPPPPSYPPSPTEIVSSPESESSADGDKPNTGLIVGVVIGILILVALIVVLIFIFVIRRRKLDNTSESGKQGSEEEPTATTETTTCESVADTWSATTDNNMFVTHNLDIQPLEMGFEEMVD